MAAYGAIQPSTSNLGRINSFGSKYDVTHDNDGHHGNGVKAGLLPKREKSVIEIIAAKCICPCCRECCCQCCNRCCTKRRFFCWYFLLMIALAALCYGGYKYLTRGFIHFDPEPDPDPLVPSQPHHIWLSSSPSVRMIPLAWSRAEHHRSAIKSYHIRLHQLATNDDRDINVGLQLSYNVTSLQPETVYTIRVRALNGIGYGNWSDTLTIATANATVPTTPGAPLLSHTSTTSLSIRWTPSEDRGFAIEDYIVHLRQASSIDEWIMVARTRHCNTTITDLLPATRYTMRVMATTEDDDGNSTWSSDTTYHTDDSEHVDVPSAANITSASSNSHSLTLIWSPPLSDGGAEILQYEIIRDDGHDPTVIEDRLVTSGMDHSATFDNLIPSTVYHIHVRAVNSFGAALWSQPLIMNTTNPEPPLPPSHVVVTDVDGSSVTLQWQSGTSYGVPILAYQVWRDDWWLNRTILMNTNITITATPGVTNGSVRVHDLLPATTYTFSMRENNTAGWSELSSPSIQFTTNSQGGCGNVGDLTVYRAGHYTLDDGIRQCFEGCLGKVGQCALDCMHNQLGFSYPCAKCWSNEAQCTLLECWFPCIDSESQACIDCSKQKCMPECQKCTGLPEWVNPA